jgi:hypothetical protein
MAGCGALRGRLRDVEPAERIEQEVTVELPIRAELRDGWLLAFEGQWTVRGRFKFGDSAAS